MSNDNAFKDASDYLAGAQRTLAHAQKLYAEQQAKLANSGRLLEMKSQDDAGRTVTRYAGDIAATFSPWMAKPMRGRILRRG